MVRAGWTEAIWGGVQGDHQHEIRPSLLKLFADRLATHRQEIFRKTVVYAYEKVRNMPSNLSRIEFQSA
eukprot:3202250-Amphidinium_carterae.1